MTLSTETGETVLRPGEGAHGPQGQAHTFAVTSPTPAPRSKRGGTPAVDRRRGRLNRRGFLS